MGSALFVYGVEETGVKGPVEEKWYGAGPKMPSIGQVPGADNDPAEKVLCRVKCLPGISSCGRFLLKGRCRNVVAVICAIEWGQEFFRIAAGGGEKSNMHESGA